MNSIPGFLFSSYANTEMHEHVFIETIASDFSSASLCHTGMYHHVALRCQFIVYLHIQSFKNSMLITTAIKNSQVNMATVCVEIAVSVCTLSNHQSSSEA